MRERSWKEAGARRISLAELIRRLVQRHLEEKRASIPVPSEAYLKIVALGSKLQMQAAGIVIPAGETPAVVFQFRSLFAHSLTPGSTRLQLV